MGIEECAVRLRVGDEQDQSIDLSVALLESKLSIERLDISEARLRFDGNERIEPEDAVPCSPVAWDWQRDLGVQHDTIG
jgi:hypothetical protein